MTILHRKGRDKVVPEALSRSLAAATTRSASTWYDKILEEVKNNKDNFVDFRIEDGNLFKFVSIPNLPYDHRYEWKLVPPVADDGAMYLGVDKTIDRSRQRYFWPRLATEIREYIQDCKTFREVKGAYVPVVPLMGDLRITKNPWQIIEIDYIGPLPSGSC